MEVIREKIKSDLPFWGCVATVILFYIVLQLVHITCPILALTGVSCAGCGMTRAWLCLLRGDLKSALYYHPLVFLPAFVLLGFLFRKKMTLGQIRFLIVAVIAADLLVYAFRMADPSDTIVVFHPEEGIIVRSARYILAAFF